jgi:prepilin-type N-terminal cleavage/methylation domain-containing protein
MLSILSFYRKIIINVGRTSRRDLKAKNGFTVIELVIVLLIISIITTIESPTIAIQKIYYKHKTKVTINKIHNLISFAKRASVITNRDITLCPYDFKSYKCTDDWHNPIIIFYGNDKKILQNQLLLKENNLLSKKESILLKNFNKKNSIIFKNNNETINGTITYTNIYYNQSIIINKVGRTK